MANWQIIGTFLLTVLGFILAILGAFRSLQSSFNEQIRSLQTSLNEQFTAFRNEMKAELKAVETRLVSEIENLRNEVRQNDKRYEDRFNHIDEQFVRVEADIREIKSILASVVDQLAGVKSDINELRLNNKLYEERFARIEADLREIKSMQASFGDQQSGLKDQLASVKYEVELLRNDFARNDKRYEDRFARVEADIREIKNDLQQALQSA